MSLVTILLTFDDGPHALSGSNNRTRKILAALRAESVVAAFYIQAGVPHRTASVEGRKVVSEANGVEPVYDHVIDIHTAGTVDHDKHWADPDRLARDLPKAVADIQALTNRRPATIRAVGLELANPRAKKEDRDAMETRIRGIYAASSLKHVGINIDSYDNTRAFWIDGSRVARSPKAAEVKEALSKGIAFALQSGPRDLLVLFHDINKTTADNLRDYVTEIRTAVALAGHTAAFTASRDDVANFLTATTIDGNESWPLDKRRP
jgi:peptidoglycan/xylan/chitin deacetylase (PgdA/CDA1 family)